MHQMNRIQKIDKFIRKLSTTKDQWVSLAIAIDIADEIMKGIVPDKNGWHESLSHNSQVQGVLPEPLPLDIFKTKKQETWFAKHPILGSARVALSHFRDDNSVLESRFYWFSEKITKQKVSVSTQFLMNWEDSDLTRNENYKVAIDFFLTHDTNTLMMVLTDRQKLRVMEFNGSLSNTQKQILSDKLFTIPFVSDSDNVSLQEHVHTALWDAFQLKEVNNKFYQGISRLYNTLVNHLKSENDISEDDSKQFSSRLLGRLLFIWFLRKMDLINEEMNYFETEGISATDYYNKQLKLLFFETLNTPISERDIIVQDEVTPYLNGGLFEKKDNDFDFKWITFPEKYFTKLYNHFNEFNFTVDESSIDYELVAVDPEMLGQIFESLLASQSKENETNERNKTGSFYTPRHIVDYMCKESIRQYLYREIDNEKYNKGINDLIDLTDAKFLEQISSSTLDIFGVDTKIVVPKVKKALDKVKVIDPAVGSGAFPMGMLQVISKLYERILPSKQFNSYEVKLGIIENNIYGVDLQPMATEISRLRAWLAIIVDDYRDNKKVNPLPNLDFKFISANSIVELEDSAENQADQGIEEKLFNIQKKYFRARSAQSKMESQNEYLKESQNIDLFEDKRSIQLKSFNPFSNVTSASFFDSEIMFGIKKGSFDIIIGNPPYLLEGKVDKSLFKDIAYYQGKMDIWYSFACLGIDMLSEGGILSFIAKNNWVTNEGASILRNKVINDTKIHELIDFGNFQVFEHASQQTMIMTFIKDNVTDNYDFNYIQFIGSDTTSNTQIPIEILARANTDTKYLTPKINRVFYIDSYLTFSKEDDLLKELTNTAMYLTRDEISQGIVFPQNNLNTKNKNILGEGFNVGDGVFVLSTDEIEKLTLNNEEKALLKPHYTSKQINLYYTEKETNEYVIYTNSKFNKVNSMDNYPNLKSHLDKFQKIITSSNKPYGLHRARDKNIFYGEKIIATRKSVDRPKFSYNNFECYVSQTFNIIQTDRFNLLYLTGLLNSKVVNFWLKYKGKKQGDVYQLDNTPLTKIPIRHSEYEEEIGLIVSKILEAYDLETTDEISQLERQLNHYIYMTYELSNESIRIIENDLE